MRACERQTATRRRSRKRQVAVPWLALAPLLHPAPLCNPPIRAHVENPETGYARGMKHPQLQARRNPQEARFSELTARVLRHRPVTPEQVRDIGTLAADLAVIKPVQHVRSKVIAFPPPAAPAGTSNAIAQLTKALAELEG